MELFQQIMAAISVPLFFYWLVLYRKVSVLEKTIATFNSTKEAVEKTFLAELSSVALLRKEKEDLSLKLEETVQSFNTLLEEHNKIIFSKKSSEVRTGLIVEQLAPFLEGFPHNPDNVKFIGKPIDFIAFTADKVEFIEVKSGGAQLSAEQRRIKKLIEEGKVSFSIYRISGK